MLRGSLLSVVRLVFGMVSTIAPELAGKTAFKLFCTPPKPTKVGPNSPRRLRSNSMLFETARQWQLGNEKYPFVAYSFNDSAEKTIVLVHGFHSRALFMGAFVQPLVDHGFKVIALDFPAHGRSPGRYFHVGIGVSALEALFQETGPWHGVIAHSLGCVVTATLAAGTIPFHLQETQMGKLVFISSPNSVVKLFDTYVDAIGLKGRSVDVFVAKVKEVSERDADAFVVADQLESAASSVLLFHAPDDKEIDFTDSEEICMNNELATLIPVPDQGHRRILASGIVVKESTRFLSERLLTQTYTLQPEPNRTEPNRTEPKNTNGGCKNK